MTRPNRPVSSDEETKVTEILESVKVTFASKGFDGASMQDLARGAGMSAGNFYRYFPSKNAIIEAMIEREIDGVSAVFGEVISAPDPLNALRELVTWRVENPDACDAPIWAEIQLMAIRRAEVAVLLARMEERLARNIVAVFGRIADLSDEEAMERFGAHARLVILLVQGLSLRSATNLPGEASGPDRALAALVGRSIERIIAEINASKQAPRTLPEHKVHVVS